MNLRGLTLRVATFAALLPGAALAHPGHGAGAAHSHGEWAAVAIVAAVLGGLAFALRRNED